MPNEPIPKGEGSELMGISTPLPRRKPKFFNAGISCLLKAYPAARGGVAAALEFLSILPQGALIVKRLDAVFFLKVLEKELLSSNEKSVASRRFYAVSAAFPRALSEVRKACFFEGDFAAIFLVF